MREDLRKAFLALWSLPKFVPFSQEALLELMSSDTLSILEGSKRKSDSWTKFEFLLKGILKAKLLSPLALEEQTLALLREEWPKVSTLLKE